MEELLDDDKRRDEILENTVEELKVHFDTVQIITTHSDKEGKVQYQSHSYGNFYERWGSLRTAEARLTANEIDG